MEGREYLYFTQSNVQSDRSLATVTIDQRLVDSIYSIIIDSQKTDVQTQGFLRGAAPRTYIKEVLTPSIVEHLRSFFFNHFVVSYLYQQLTHAKILYVGEPQLVDVQLEPGAAAQYTFTLDHVPISLGDGLHKLPFKMPQRKNYKDLDRQVELFIKEENEKASRPSDTADIGDWIAFSMTLVDEKEHPVLDTHTEELWIKMGDEEGDRPSHDLFLGKKLGDSFISQSPVLQDYLSDDFDTRYHFRISITNRVPAYAFSFDQFKAHFRIKTPKEVHSKLIEVFSFRNDLSQRRETVETSLKTLVKAYPFSIPSHLLERQTYKVLGDVGCNPDYHVYRAQKDFQHHVTMLAEKQFKEMVLIDQIAHADGITASNDDIVSYLNLTKRARMRDFIYFHLPHTRSHEQEVPLPTEYIRRFVRREKTLNHVINTLARR